MGLPKTKLEYVNASGNWTQAVTPSGQDAVVMLHIAQGINTSSKCDVIMANQSPDPENANPAQAKGNLTDVFTDFQRIRLVDQETGIVIFTGRIYRIRDKYDLQYGQTIRVYGFDAYKELIEYPIEDPPSSLKSIDTTSSSLGGFDVRKRSQLIKYILSELDLNDNISVSDTDHWDDSWSTDSFQDKDLNISKIDRRIAGVIQDLAIGDPLKNVSGADIGESGYDFRVEPYFTSCAVDHKPIEMMNYFQRGTRPGRGGAYSNESSPTLCTTSTDSLTIQYPSAGDTGLLRSMLSSFEFDKPKEELYTALILHYKDESQEDQNNDQEGSSGKEGIVTFELLKGATTGTFTWANKALDASKSTPPELLNVSGGATGVARVQWHESGYLLVSNINEATFPTTGTITLVGADSGASFVMNAATQRMVTKIGVKRPIRIARNLTSNVYALRKEVVSRLIGRTDLEIVRGKFQTIRYPFVYHDLPSNASRSTNTITWSGTVDAQARGIRKAYVVAQIDSDGNYVRYAYISAVNSATSISYGTGATDTSDGTALDVTDTIRLIVPIRPGDVVKAVHTTSNINTDQVILELLYDESPGIMGANYTTVGSNGKFNNIFGDSDAVKSAIASAQSKNFPPELPLSEQAFVFDGFINRGSNPSDSNDYRKIHWSNNAGATSGTAGTLTAGDGTKYTIACASSATLTEAEYTFFFRPTSAKATANKSNTTFQLVLATSYVKDPSDIRLGWAKAVPAKAGAKAILVLAPQLQSRDLFAAGGVGTLTDALFSKSAQEYASGLEIKPVTSGSNKHRRVTWAACTSAEDRLTFGDGDYWSIAADGGNYSYTANGSSYTNLTLLDVSSTYYVFIDTADTASGGTLTLRFTKSYSHISTASDGTYSSARVIMGQIAVPANGDDGAAPRIFPFNNRSLTVNAASIAAEAITATHITASAITTSHIQAGGLPGSVLNIDSNTTFASGYDPTEIEGGASTSITSTAPSGPSNGDLWIDEGNDDRLMRYNGTAWVHWDLGLARATANTGVSNAATAAAAAAAAATTANAASSKLTDIASDSKLTPDEKLTSKVLYETILNEYSGIQAQGSTQGVSTSNYTTYYNALVTYIGSTIYAFNSMSSTTDITRSTWNSRWENYYTYRQQLLNAIAADAESKADSASSAATSAANTAATKRTTFVDSVANDATGQNGPVAVAVGDVWVNGHADSQKIFLCASISGTKRVIGTNWILRSDAGAINNATTNISGGLINTQTIILTDGGANTNPPTNVLQTGGGTPTGGTRIILSHDGIYGWNNSTAQFYLLAEDGKAYFGGGSVIANSSGLHIKQSGATKYLNLENGSGGLQSAFYTADPITQWFTPSQGNNDPTSVGKEIYIGSGSDPGAAVDYRSTPQTKVINLQSAYIGIWPKGRVSGTASTQGPVFYQFPDSTPGTGTQLVQSGSSFTKTIGGTSRTVYPLDWAHHSGTHTGVVTGDGLSVSEGANTGGTFYMRGINIGSYNTVSINSSWYLRRSSSSLMWKENPRPIAIDTSKVLALAPRTFTWKDIEGVGEEIRGKDDFGLIAEEVNEILPELVLLDEDNNPSSVNYQLISVLLLEEMKKLTARIEVLEGN